MGKRLGRLFWIIAVAFALRACVFEPVRVTDDAMAPLLHDGEVVFVSKLRYGLRVPGPGAMLVEWTKPQKGDLVVAVTVGDPPVNVLRRIAAAPGDKVALGDGKEAVLKDEEYFLAAERGDAAVDSRRLGIVTRRSIIGKATYRWLRKKPSTGEGSQVESEKSGWRFLQPIQ